MGIAARVEDKAHCLMGVFSVYTTTLHGKERQAFYWLQEKIVKPSVDTPLFLWASTTLSRGISTLG